MTFEGTPRPMADRTVPTIAAARSFAIALHQLHGWAIRERYPLDGEAER